LIALLLLAPWIFAASTPWLSRLPWPTPATRPSPLERKAALIRNDLQWLRDRNHDLVAQIAQTELNLRIDQHATDLAAAQITALEQEAEHLDQGIEDLLKQLGANIAITAFRRLEIQPLGGARYSYRLRLTPQSRDHLAAGATLSLWLQGQWQPHFLKTARETLKEKRLRIPLEPPAEPVTTNEIHGEFDLPEGFAPESMTLELLSQTTADGKLQQSIPWDLARAR
jgi:hypothetical protein